MVNASELEVQLHHDIGHQIVAELRFSFEVFNQTNGLQPEGTIGKVLEVSIDLDVVGEVLLYRQNDQRRAML